MTATGRRRRRFPRTEERLFPATRRPDDRMMEEHWARYRFAAPRLAGRVCDLGCGTGYGSREIAGAAAVREVVAVDRAEEAARMAGCYYPHPKVSLRRLDLERSGWESDLGRFDAVVAFELIEHLREEAPLWRGIGRILRPGGSLWISTPLGRGRGRSAADPFHVHQLRRSEVLALFRSGWRDRRVYGQTGGWIEPWEAGRRYYTILVRAIRTEEGA